MIFFRLGEVNKASLKSLAHQTFGCKPFGWQIATAVVVIGPDIILDIGTGSSHPKCAVEVLRIAFRDGTAI